MFIESEINKLKNERNDGYNEIEQVKDNFAKNIVNEIDLNDIKIKEQCHINNSTIKENKKNTFFRRILDMF